MESLKYTKEFDIYYYQIDSRQKATPITILNFLEETAISHSESVGLGVQSLLDQNLCWILNRWSLVMDCYPALKDRITIETWPSHFEKFYATRQFQIKNDKGIIIGRAVSLWILINYEKRRPTRIPEEFGEKYGINPTEAINSPFSGLDTNFEPEFGITFNIRRSDIDTNKHVNNSKYVEWALEVIPQDVYDNYSLHTLEVEYKRELSYGSAVNSICRSINECNGKQEFAHRILGPDKQTDHALAKTVWVK